MSLADLLHLSPRAVHAPHDTAKPLLEVRGVTVRYDGREAISNVSFELGAGELVAVVGPNGAGKSTLFKAVAGLLEPQSGDVRVYGNRPSKHTCIAYLPQRSQVDWLFPVSVEDVVLMGRSGTLGLFRHASRADREVARELLGIVGLADLGQRQIGELSGGQQQRMFIARALAMRAELMLMDEPFAGLDAPSQEGILQILDELVRRRVTALVALHDLNLAAEHFSKAILLNRVLAGCGKPDDVFTSERLLSVYGAKSRRAPSKAGVYVVDDGCCGGGHSHE